MTLFLSLQNSYQQIEVGLYDDNTCISSISENKIRASKSAVPLIAYTLMQAQKTLDDIDFIAVNQGPGPFTTLRVIIATANGISYATKKPLVGVDALEAFLSGNTKKDAPYTVALLNAFNNDVYFALQKEAIIIDSGYDNISSLLKRLKNEIPANASIRFIGNGTELHAQEIRETMGTQAIIQEDLPLDCSLNQIARLGRAQWQEKKNISGQLQPLYLKRAL